VDGDLYWKMNTVDTKRLMWNYDTVAGLFSATGLEAHGQGATPKRGTDPRFASFPLQIVDRSRPVWEIPASSERLRPSHVLLSASSPARGAGIVIPPHPVHGALPDSRASRDIGAYPYGTSATEFDRFPFDPDAGTGLVDVPEPPAGAAALALEIAPHPVVRRARVAFTLPAAGPARAELLDAQGRRVRLLLDRGWLPAGRHTLELDARAASEPLRAGVYFYRVTTARAHATGRLIVMP
jgi:hypothetical protein